MRSTIVTADNYEDLRLVHTFRRLYQSPTAIVTTAQKQDLARRLSMGYRILKERSTSRPQDSGAGSDEGRVLAREMKELRARLEAYESVLSEWGLKDYQVPTLETAAGHFAYYNLLFAFLRVAVIWLLASIPSLILNAPVGFAASRWAIKEAKKDLKASRVH